MTQPPNPGEYPPPGGYPPPPAGGYGPPPPGWGYPPPGAYPSQGGYPPPGGFPQGGYPPPGGYPPGAYPPPGGYPPPGAYPPPADGGWSPPPGHRYSVGDALSWAWQKFAKNAVPLLVSALIINVILLALTAVFAVALEAVSPQTLTAMNTASGVVETTSSTLTNAGVAVVILGFLAVLVATGAALSAYIGGVLDIANGLPVTVGSFLRPRNVAPMIVATLIGGILAAIGLVLCIVPGILVMIFTLFYPVAIVDRNLSAIEGIRTAVDIARRNFGSVFLAWLISTLIMAIGGFCLVLTVLAWPLTYLFLVYSYRRLTGSPVAAVTA